jgi:hypothetical protein
VGHVAEVLIDVPAMPERVIELAVQVPPEHVLQRLSDLGSSINRPCERRLAVGDIEGQDDRRAADRGGASTPISGNSSEMCKRWSPMRS